MANNKSQAALRLLENKDFQELVLHDFIRDGMLSNTLQDNVRSEGVQDELIARRILHEWFYGIITTGEMPEN